MTEIGVEAEFAIEEPSLCFHRLEYDCPRICEQTEISCVAAHYKLIVLGHMNGAVNVFDHLGNLIQNGSHKKHFCPINQLGISEDGNFVVSCADDGFVFIYNLTEPGKNELVNLTRPVKSVAIAPNYLKTSKIVTADKTISIHSRGAFGRRTTEKLYSPPGVVEAMIWRGDILIWADSAAVRIYNVRRRQLINYVPKPATQANNLEGPTRCQLAWHSNSCFLIGWDKTLQVCHILHPPKSEYDAAWSSAASNDDTESIASSSISHFSNTTVAILPKQFVKISAQINVGPRGLICGLATHQNRLLVLLYPPRSIESLLVVSGANREEERRPQILVADVGEALTNPNATGGASDVDSLLLPEGEDAFEEISLEGVEIKCPPNRGFQGLGLVSIIGDEAHFIYSPMDIIYAQALSADDRIDWFLKQDIPKRALQIAEENRSDLVRHSFKKLGMDYLEKLLGERNYLEAAALCKQILTDRESWEAQIHRFLQLGELHILVPYLPTSRNVLCPGTYEIILIELLNKSPQLFLQKLKDWPPNSGLYSLEPVTRALVQRTSSTADQDLFELANTDADMGALWRALIVLYEASGQPERGLEVALRLKDSGVFDLLSRHLVLPPPPGTSAAAAPYAGSVEDPAAAGRFVAAVGRHLLELCQIDVDAAVSIMLDCVKDLPVDFVVHELDPQPQFLFKYLSALRTRHPRSALPYAQRLVQLYAAYARHQLLAYLRSTHEYPLNEALALCQSLGFVPETVYLLTRVGRRKDALRLLMEKGADDALLLSNRDLTPEQRQAEIAAQAIAYCLEEDYYSGSGGVFLTYDTSASNNPRLRRAAHRRLLLNKRSRAGSTGTEEDEEREAGTPKEQSEEDGEEEGFEERAEYSEREAGELWRQVVLFAVDKPGFICALLRHASTERIDPSLLLRKIAPETEIPCLKESLMTLLRNTKMQIELRRNCLDILLKDLHEVSSRLVRGQNRGVFVDLHKQQAYSKASGLGSNACRVCRGPLLASSEASGGSQSAAEAPEMGHQPSLVVFRCSHVFHSDCVLQDKRKSYLTTLCPICVQERTAAA